MARNKDFRVDVQFLGNLKIRKLKNSLGSDGVLALFALWAYVAAFRPSGLLERMDDSDIEAAVDWHGARGQFASTLRDLGLVDEREQGVLAIHDWLAHNGYAAHAEERSARSRALSNRRWDKGRAASSNGSSVDTAERRANEED